MAFFNDRQLRASFLSIASRAWTIYCKEALVDSSLFTVCEAGEIGPPTMCPLKADHHSVPI
jgi:hypothetical protein